MILAYNTSLADLDIGLFSDSAELLAEFHYQPTPDDRGIHDRLLAQKTSDLLKEISASPKDISRIAFINGPGSFTGLRIGLAFAKGMAFGSITSPVGWTLSPPGISLIPLIAHSVLLKSYLESRTTNHDSRLAILYPGYSKDSVYLSYSNEPEKISYIKIADLIKLNLPNCICPPQLQDIGIPHTAIPISLKTMAEISVSGTDFSPLINLEPFYGTDFKPTV